MPFYLTNWSNYSAYGFPGEKKKEARSTVLLLANLNLESSPYIYRERGGGGVAGSPVTCPRKQFGLLL